MRVQSVATRQVRLQRLYELPSNSSPTSRHSVVQQTNGRVVLRPVESRFFQLVKGSCQGRYRAYSPGHQIREAPLEMTRPHHRGKQLAPPRERPAGALECLVRWQLTAYSPLGTTRSQSAVDRIQLKAVQLGPWPKRNMRTEKSSADVVGTSRIVIGRRSRTVGSIWTLRNPAPRAVSGHFICLLVGAVSSSP
jgi:hypothetical protein